MSRGKKMIIALFVIIDLIVFAGVFYGVRMTNDASDMVASIHEKIDRKSTKKHTASIDDAEPFSVLLLGVDTGDLGRTEQGRSDTMMVVTINPEKKQSTVVSLERDLLTEIVGNGTSEKLNHAYAYGGVEMTMDTIETLLDTPLDHYVTINMKGLRDLIDAVGGIEVDNKIPFELDGVVLDKGKQTLDGDKGLAYARMRHEDPDGDIGRQRRQREVVQKIIKKILSVDGVGNYKKLLKAVEKNMKTDLDWDDMLDIAESYRPALTNVKNYQLQGQNQMIDGISYQILSTKDLLKTQNLLKRQLNLETSETLPNLKDPEQAVNFIINSDYPQAEDGTPSSGDTQYSDGTSSTGEYYNGNVDPNSGNGQAEQPADPYGNTVGDANQQGYAAQNGNGYAEDQGVYQPVY